MLRPNRETSTYLALELKTPRLNDIHHHLWLAGLPTHRQQLLGRNILVTEDPDEHLIWFKSDIFIKHLPDFLLDWNFWNDSLCPDQELHETACGLLLSYAWLVRYKSNLNVTKEAGMLSKNMEWSKWVEFIDTFLDNIDCEALSVVNKRYKYGEPGAGTIRVRARKQALHQLSPKH